MSDITYGTRVAIVRRERISAGRRAAFREAHPFTADHWFQERARVKVGLTGKVTLPINVGNQRYYLVRLDGFPAFGETGTVMVKSFEIEQEKNMSDTFQRGQRVRVTGLNFGCFTAFKLKQVGAFREGDTPLREAAVGKVGEIVGRVSTGSYGDLEAYFVRTEDGVRSPAFLPRELELVADEPQAETPAETTTSELEDLVLELLTIFPNDEPGDVLDQDSFDADPKDVATANRVVPALRALLRNHPTEVARRKARKATQTQLRREVKQVEREADEREVAIQAQRERVNALRAKAEELRAKLD